MKKIMVFAVVVFLCTAYAASEKQRIANILPGKIVFSSNRSDDGKMYAYILENGKIENLGFEACPVKFSPTGRLLALFARNEVSIYNLKKKKVEKKYSFKYPQYLDVDWTKDGRYLVYGVKEQLNSEKKFYNTYLMRMNVKNGREEILQKYTNVDFWYDIGEIYVSPDNKRMVLTIGDMTGAGNSETVSKLYVMNIDGQYERALWEMATPLGWYPDGKNILIHTNNDNKGNKINNQRGRLYKLNADTLETEIVEETITNVYGLERLTRDGNFIYSSRYFFNPYFSYSIVCGRPGKRDDEAMVTYHVPYTYHSETKYSEDSAPDWWYE